MSNPNDIKTANVTNNADGSVTITFKQSIIRIVKELPEIGESDVIYLRAQAGEGENNLYTEHIYIDGKWEDLGVRKLDLADYLTKTEAKTTYSNLNHTHSYTSLTDLPTIVQIGAKNYSEFEAAVEKLKPIVADGGFGEIIQTGDWIVPENKKDSSNKDIIKIYDLKNVSINNLGGGSNKIDVTKAPLRIENCASITGSFFYSTKQDDNTLSLVSYYNQPITLTLKNATFHYCLTHKVAKTPLIDLISKGGTPHLLLDACSASSGSGTVNPVGLWINRGANISGTNKLLVLMVDSIMIKGGRDASNIHLTSVEKISEGNLVVSNSWSATKDANCDALKLELIDNIFSGQREGLVPSPTEDKKKANYALNALGQWDDLSSNHTHSYTNLTDLPSIVEIAAVNYAQFKNAVAKLQEVVANGGFGEIIQTGDWVVPANEPTYNMKSISIRQMFGMINISNGYMNLIDAPLLERLYFRGDTDVNSTDNKKAIELSFTKSSFTRMLGCTFDRCLCEKKAENNPVTPTITLNKSGGTPALLLDDFDAGTVSMPLSIKSEKMIIRTDSDRLALFIGKNPNKGHHVTDQIFVDCANATAGTITNDIYYNVTTNGAVKITPANRAINKIDLNLDKVDNTSDATVLAKSLIQVKEESINVGKFPLLKYWEQGGISVQGEDYDETSSYYPRRLRTKKLNMISVIPNQTYLISRNGNYDVSIMFYDENEVFVGESGWIGGISHEETYAKTVKTPSNAIYIRLLLCNNKDSVSNTPITLKEVLDANISITAVSYLKIGGTNLCTNTNFRNGFTGWSKWGDVNYVIAQNIITATINSGILLGSKIDLEAGKEYTVSAEIRSDNYTELNYNYIIGSNGGGTNQIIRSVKINAEWSRVSITFIPNVSQKQVAVGFGSSKYAVFQLRKYKLESGSIATDWTHAIEEYALYEEGPWNPTIGGGTTNGVAVYTTQKGSYRRIGNLVSVCCTIVGTFTTKPTGEPYIRGLPFLAKELATARGMFRHMDVNTVLAIGEGASYCNFRILKGFGTNAGNVPTYGVDFSDDKFDIWFEITYHI